MPLALVKMKGDGRASYQCRSEVFSCLYRMRDASSARIHYWWLLFYRTSCTWPPPKSREPAAPGLLSWPVKRSSSSITGPVTCAASRAPSPTHGFEPVISCEARAIAGAEVVILPGVGASADTMRNLRGRSRRADPRYSPAAGRFSASAWASRPCSQSARRAASTNAWTSCRPRQAPPRGRRCRTWAGTRCVQRAPPDFRGHRRRRRLLLRPLATTHVPNDDSVVIGETDYGGTFASVCAGNVFATQFHPEKSGTAACTSTATSWARAGPPQLRYARGSSRGGAVGIERHPGDRPARGRVVCASTRATSAAKPSTARTRPRWRDAGKTRAPRLHVVDLDGARDGLQANAGAVEAIVAAVSIPVELGGGVRDLDTVAHWVERGVDRVFLGTAAVTDPPLVRDPPTARASRAASPSGPTHAMGASPSGAGRSIRARASSTSPCVPSRPALSPSATRTSPWMARSAGRTSTA